MDKRISITLSDDLHEGLTQLADDTGAPVAELVRDAVTAFLAERLWKEGIGATAEAAIGEGLDNKAVLARVLERHPDAKTTMNSVRWYRSKLKASGG